MRVFSSAPIHRRYDVFTLETTDGICVIIKGFMNKARTVENGFPSEVCLYNFFSSRLIAVVNFFNNVIEGILSLNWNSLALEFVS